MRVQRGVRFGAALVVAAGTVFAAPVPALAVEPCRGQPPPGTVVSQVPYEDAVYTPKLLGPLAAGRRTVKVAVVDSGVDATNVQLAGQVEPGRDLLRNDGDGRQDCVGHGTGVASIIAGRPVDGVGFQGLAPSVKIVPVRISEDTDQVDKDKQQSQGGARPFAEAITWAARQPGVRVINLSLVMIDDAAPVRQAIRFALERGVVVVAAAGNNATQGKPANRPPHPADYDGVIGVGSLTAEGSRASYSQFGDWVDIAAFGDGVTMAAVGKGQRTDSGTSFATPMVSATVALMLQKWPAMTPAEVERRLKATADPAPGGRPSPEYGWGLLNPYRALTDSLGPDVPVAAPAPPVVADDPVAAALRSRRERARARSLLFAAGGVGVVVLVAAGAIVLRQGRRRGWRPGAADAGQR